MNVILAYAALSAAFFISHTSASWAACEPGVPIATFAVSSGSMLPTISPPTTVFATCFHHAIDDEAPQPEVIAALYPSLVRGDIVTLRYPPDPNRIWLSRVIGLPGDHIQVKDGQLYINGSPVPRAPAGDYTADDDGIHMVLGRYLETLPGGIRHYILKATDEGEMNNTPDYAVPAANVFVMGDTAIMQPIAAS